LSLFLAKKLSLWVVDLRRMHKVKVDPERQQIVTEGGCTMLNIYEACEPYNLAFGRAVGRFYELILVGALATPVGVGGLTLGGGYGYLTGQYGEIPFIIF
jgi:FAD/FMN-containing dehydrogenase